MVVGIDDSKRSVLGWWIGLSLFYGLVAFATMGGVKADGWTATFTGIGVAAFIAIVQLGFLFEAYSVKYEAGVLHCKTVWHGSIDISADSVHSITVHLGSDEDRDYATIRYNGLKLCTAGIGKRFPEFCRHLAGEHPHITLEADRADYFDPPPAIRMA